MTADQNSQLKLEAKLKDATDENNLLLRQLHQVQEELERHYLQNRELEKRQAIASQSVALDKGWVDDELPDTLTENRRLQALVDAQKRIHQLGAQNALNIKLGNILIRGADSPISLLGVPSKLVKIWWQSGRQTPPKSLGGKGFDNVIEAYGKGGLDAVEKLMAKASVDSVMRANAYTVLARKLMNSDRVNAATAARRAYEIDPKSYRLKWLAFRLHESSEVIEAEAILETLPQGTPFSESETRQANQVRYEALNARRSEAEQKSGFVERRARAEKQLTNLSRERDEQAKLAAERGREVEVLRQAKVQLERERQVLSGKHDEQAKLAAERGREVEVLRLAKVQLEQERQALSGKHDEQAKLAAARGREVDVLRQARVQLEQEGQALSGKHDEQAKLAVERGREVDVLRQAKVQLEQEVKALSGKHEEQAELAAERGREVEVLKQAKAQLERERQALSGKRDEQATLAARRGREVGVLRQAKVQLERERQALSGKHDEQAKLAAERGREVDVLRQAKVQLERERQALSGKHDEQAKLAAERGREVEVLRQAKTQLEQERQALSEKHDEQAKLAAERSREVEVLRQAKVQLERERQALSGKHDEQAKLVAERGREVEVLKQAKVQLEQKTQALQRESEDLRKQLQETQKLAPAKFLHAVKGRLDAMPEAGNLPDVSLVFVEHGDKVFFFTHFSSDYIPKKMAKRNQFYEAPFLDLLARLHQPGKIIIDGGANIGNHSVFFAGVMDASVIAFEPQPFNHEFLVANVRLNHLEKKIDVRKVAIGDQPGRISLTQALPDNYGSFTSNAPLAHREDKDDRALDSFDVQVSTLDIELKNFEGEISIIKLDLEGMELDVLTGARVVIEKSLPVIAVECLTKSLYGAVKKFLASFGYFVIDSTNATPTFIFLTRQNPHHMEILSQYLEASSIGKFSEDFSFNEAA